MITEPKNVALRTTPLVVHEDTGINTAVVRHSAHTSAVISLLNAALATELVSVLRYRCHHFLALAIHSPHAAQRFMAHADAGVRHTDLLAARIVKLGGAPNFSPEALTSHSHPRHFSGDSLPGAVREDLLAVGRLMDDYRGMLANLGENDPVTRQMLAGILTVKEAHADALSELLVARFRAGALMLETQRRTLPTLAVAL